LHLLLDKHRGGELPLLPAFFNARVQKQNAQVLFHRPRAEIKMARTISLLLHPCTSRRNTCWSRGVILISLSLIIGFSSAPSVQFGVATRQNRGKRFAKCSLINNII
jgi:hypothetical protein